MERFSYSPLFEVEEADGGCADNTSTDNEECVSVVCSVTGRVKNSTVIDGKVKSPLKLTRSEAPLHTDIGNHVSLVKIENPNKTVATPKSPSVAVLSDDK